MFSCLSLVVKHIMHAVESSHDIRNKSDYILYYPS
jgi:hypothetical protein